jgi:GR25 family glycosyltransferase involved in LPS biosynthesis
MNLNDLSDSIYVINLKEREDRKVHIISELKKIECKNYTIFEAIDGQKLQNNTKLKTGMFGLINTYLNLHEEWSKTNSENILIIEDDCVFMQNFNDDLELYIKNVPTNWEMLYFGGNHNYHMGSKTEKINEFCVKLNNTYSAHCVLMKKKVFEELIENLKTFEIENDVMMANLQKKFNAYSPTNKLTTQTPSYSNIEERFVDYNWLMK